MHAHIVVAVTEKYCEMSIIMVVIPSKLMKIIQLLDITITKSLKCELGKDRGKCMNESLHTTTKLARWKEYCMRRV